MNLTNESDKNTTTSEIVICQTEDGKTKIKVLIR